MSKDKDNVVKFDPVTAKEMKKALCTVVVTRLNNVQAVYQNVAGYQLLEKTLIILIHDGSTHLIPTESFAEVEIKANKE